MDMSQQKRICDHAADLLASVRVHVRITLCTLVLHRAYKNRLRRIYSKGEQR